MTIIPEKYNISLSRVAQKALSDTKRDVDRVRKGESLRFFGASNAKSVYGFIVGSLYFYSVGGFFMEKNNKFRLVFSDFLMQASTSVKIAYIAVITALSVVFNMYLRFSITPDLQFSCSIFASVLCGILLGGVMGFPVCVLSDFIRWVVKPSGMYLPWIGISSGIMALIAGIIFNNFKSGKRLDFYLKGIIVSLSTFLICTVLINTTLFYYLYGIQSSYFTYLVTRLFINGQIWNSVFNYALLFLVLPVLSEVKPLKKFFL